MRSTSSTDNNQELTATSRKFSWNTVFSLGLMTSLAFIGRRSPSFRIYRMAKSAVDQHQHTVGLYGVLTKKSFDFFKPSYTVKNPFDFFKRENKWIKDAFATADEAVQKKELLLIFPAIPLDVRAMHELEDKTGRGMIIPNPTFEDALYHFTFIDEELYESYNRYMYIANMSPFVIAHELAHYWLLTHLKTPDESRDFTEKMNQLIKADLLNLSKKMGPEKFKRDLTVMYLLNIEKKYGHLEPEHLAREYFAQIVQLSLSSEVGFENIKQLLPKSTDYISRLYEKLQHTQNNRIEVIEETPSLANRPSR